MRKPAKLGKLQKYLGCFNIIKKQFTLKDDHWKKKLLHTLDLVSYLIA
jgi:hypothetical protein